MSEVVERARHPGGRPTLYRDVFPEQAFKLALLGADDTELADFFGVVVSTISNWKVEYPEFMEAIARGKVQADAEVAEKLYHRAKGYSHPEVHVSNFQGDITLTHLTKHYPPDTHAASLWLRNRQGWRWKDKQNVETATLGADGKPIDPRPLTAEEREARAQALLSKAARLPASSVG